MFRAIFIKDLRLFTRRPQWRVFLVLMAAAMALSMLGGVARHRAEARAFDDVRVLQQKSLTTIKYSLSLLGPGHGQQLSPTPLSIFSAGAEDVITAPFITRTWSKQIVGYQDVRGPIARMILGLDIATFVTILLVLCLLYLAHDVATNEIWAGTLRINELFGVSPRLYLASKILATVIATVVPFAAMYLVSVAFVATQITLDGEQLVRLALIGIAFVVYLCWWVLMAVGIQLWLPSGPTTLAALLLAWILCVYVAPEALQVASPMPTSPVASYYEGKKEAYLPLKKEWREGSIRSERLSPGGVADFYFFAEIVEKTLREGHDPMKGLAELEAHYFGATSSFSIVPSCAIALITAELAGVGVGDYYNMRRGMVRYHDHFYALLHRADFDKWTATGSDVPPKALLRDLDNFQMHRLGLKETLANVAKPGATLLGSLLLLLLAVLLFGPSRLRRIR